MRTLSTPRQSQPTRSRELLDQNRDMVLVFLNGQLNELFDHTDEAMMDFAEQAQNNAMRGRLFEAMVGVRKYRNDIEHRFRTAILDGFAAFGAEPGVPAQDAAAPPSPELTLLEPDEMEELVAGENLVTKCCNSYFTQLYALRQRLAILSQGRKVAEAQIPAGPSHLVRAFRQAISDLHIDMKPKIVLYALYDKFVLCQLQGLYEELNGNLKNAGILPNLKPVVLKPGDPSDARALEAGPGGEAPGETPATADDGRGGETPRGDAPSPAWDGGSAGEAGGGPAAAPNHRPSLGEELFDSILELMSMRRGGGYQGVKSPSTGHWGAPGGRPAAAAVTSYGRHMLHAATGGQGHYYGGGAATSHRQLLSAVDRLRPPRVGSGQGVLSDLEALPQLAVDPRFLDKVKQALTHEREQILSQVDRSEVQSLDADTIDLIGMLFEYMLNDPLLPNVTKALISHLHTPYLKLALTDQQVLVDSEHPARQMLDLLVEAGGLWVYENDIKRGIFPQMQQVVDRVLQEAVDDPELFSELLEYFHAAMDEQRRRSDALERRSQEALKGKERLLEVKKRAAQEITIRIRQVRLPKPIKRFLAQAWTDRLVFILLRHKEGERSPEWQRALRVTGDLVGLFDPQSARVPRRKIENIGAGVLSEIRAALESLGGYHQHHLEDLVRFLSDPQAVMDWHQQPHEGPDSELLFEDSERLPEGVTAMPPTPATAASGATTTQPVPGKTAVPPQPPPPDNLSAREQEMVGKLRHIKFGTWFELQDDGGTPRRLKLSWLSPLTATCMFVDRAGIQAEVRGLAEVARMLISGKARVLPQPRRGFVQRTLVSIKNALKQSMEATG